MRQVRYLDRQGIVEPSVHRPTKKGSPAQYSYLDVVAMKVLARVSALAAGEVRPERARAIAGAIAAAGEGRPLDGINLVADESAAWIEEEDSERLLQLLREAGALVCVSLRKLEKELQLASARLGLPASEASEAQIAA